MQSTPQRGDALRDALRQATLGDYEIMTELGRGGMATVFLAHDIALGRKVAIKVMSPQLFSGEGMAERFKREARTAAQLSHPHIIPIYSVQESGDLLFFVMKFIEGRPLDSIIREVGALPIPMVRTILMQVGGALGYAHKRGVIHRDIKPANIMLDSDGWAIVTDFGIAKVKETQGLTVTGATVGTPSYMSPEQCAAQELTGATDQYSLGVVAYEMLSGKLPFIAESVMAVMYAHFNQPPRPVVQVRPDCPLDLASTVMRMLEKDQAQRFPTMEAATSAMGTVSLSPDDPVRTQMMTLAAAGENLKLLERFSTPVSQPSVQRSGGVTTTRRSSIAVLAITPARVTVVVGDGVQLRATAKTRQGQTLGGRPVSWASTNPDIALVTETGLVSAMAPGTVTITASSADTSATATITVEAARGRGRTIGLIAGGVAIAAALALFLIQPWRSSERPPATVDTLGVRRGAGVVDSQPARQPVESAAAAVTSPAPGNPAPSGSGSPSSEDRARDRTRPPADSSDATVAVALVSAQTARSRAVSAGAVAADLSTGDAAIAQAQNLRQRGHRADAFALLRAAAGSFSAAESSATANRVTAQHRPAAVDSASRTPAPAPPPVDPTPQIRETIAAYGRALESRDVSALRRLYPQITATQAQAWQDLFDNARDIHADLRPSQIDVNGDQADVAVSGTLSYQNTNTRRQERNPTTFRARLTRAGGAWVITAIQ
ncbi:MAG TPA: protein kinase [Gemmatimonadales bacterium]|nr:protein kinase [Gemmatimonadales bacterium]